MSFSDESSPLRGAADDSVATNGRIQPNVLDTPAEGNLLAPNSKVTGTKADHTTLIEQELC